MSCRRRILLMDVLEHIDCELNDGDVSEVIDGGLSNETDHCGESYDSDALN